MITNQIKANQASYQQKANDLRYTQKAYQQNKHHQFVVPEDPAFDGTQREAKDIGRHDADGWITWVGTNAEQQQLQQEQEQELMAEDQEDHKEEMAGNAPPTRGRGQVDDEEEDRENKESDDA